MGCCQSKNDDAEQLQRIKELKEEIAASKSRHKEQHDIIRFKIEVLVNMLATEEKKTAVFQKRLETLRYIMTHDQLDHDTLSNLMTQRTDVRLRLGNGVANQPLTASFELATSMRSSTQLTTLQDESPAITAFVNLKRDYAEHKKAIFQCFAGRYKERFSVCNTILLSCSSVLIDCVHSAPFFRTTAPICFLFCICFHSTHYLTPFLH
jgi:hypothetical protein